jgi:prepilin-type N-terminal cleavage/methylation domain-containing protein
MKRKQQIGFTLIETMASLAVLVGVSAIVMTGMNRMMTTQGTISNRTEMHTNLARACWRQCDFSCWRGGRSRRPLHTSSS